MTPCWLGVRNVCFLNISGVRRPLFGAVSVMESRYNILKKKKKGSLISAGYFDLAGSSMTEKMCYIFVNCRVLIYLSLKSLKQKHEKGVFHAEFII